MFDKLKWLTVNQLVNYHTVISVFKIRSSREPEYLAEILCNDSRNNRITIPNLDLKLAQNSFSLRGSEDWNKLPLFIRQQQRIGSFKKLAKNWILANVPRFLD